MCTYGVRSSGTQTLNIFQEKERKWFQFESVCVLTAQRTAAVSSEVFVSLTERSLEKL